MSVEINNESGYEIDEAGLQRLAAFAMGAMHVHPDTDVAILLVDEATIEQLHVQWMDEPGPTDVLSFPMDELRPGSADQPTPAGLLGDIVLAAETVARGAAEKHISIAHHTAHLIVHGTLHLLGYDHEDEGQAEHMELLERSALAGLGVADPYADSV